MKAPTCFCLFASALLLAAGDAHVIRESPAPGDFPLVAHGRAAVILCDTNDFKVVQIARDLFAQDIERVTGINPFTTTDRTRAVIIGTLEQSALIREAIESSNLDVVSLRGKWESHLIAIVKNPLPQSHPGIERALLIIGSDRRGTAYGVFGLSEAIGVSPWYWWADVPPTKHTNLFIASVVGQASRLSVGGNEVVDDTNASTITISQQTGGTPVPLQKAIVQGPPSVKYRGIFLNDEDWGLQPWAAKTFEPETGDIGPKTYARIFELLLRLRANYIWPAMHDCTKAFNHFPANKQVADDYAIVVGASHCEPMLCNNVTEWRKEEFGDWNYVTNAKRIQQYWDERLASNGKFENVYTVGMRGIHDGGMPGGGTLKEKARRLETIIADQREIISRHTGKPAAEVPQIFCPYKEVLNIYRTGMTLPDDITIAWADDNHGYLRQLSDPAEQKRSGRSGVYYHLSYWGAPEDFLWLSTISPSLISYEMTKAFNYGADRLWVFNVGDIKPAEKELTFAMELAWDINRWTPEKAVKFPREWAARTFGEEHADDIARILRDYYRLAQRGKPEHLDRVAFTPAERDERLGTCRFIRNKAAAIAKEIPAPLAAAYFQLVLYPVTGAALMNEKHLLAAQSLELASKGNREALELAAAATHAHEEIERLTRIYNDDIAGGKWKRMMDSHPRRRPVFNMPRVATAEMFSQTNFIPAPTNMLAAPLVSIRPISFVKKFDSTNARITILTGFWNRCAPTLDPITAPSVAADEAGQAAGLLYDVAQIPAGPRTATFRFLPTAAIHKGSGLRAAVKIIDGEFQVLNLNAQEYSAEWSSNVLRGYSERTVPFEQPAAGSTRIEIRFLDPGLVLLEMEFR